MYSYVSVSLSKFVTTLCILLTPSFLCPFQIYAQLHGHLASFFVCQLNASFQLLFNLLLRPAFHVDDDDDDIKGLFPQEKKVSDAQ